MISSTSKATLLAAAVASFLSVATPAFTDSLQPIAVAAGDLAEALQSISKQSGVELLFDRNQIKGVRTKGVKGTLTSEQAIRKLLEGTDFELSTDESTGAMMIGMRSGTAMSNAASAVPGEAGHSMEKDAGTHEARLAQTSNDQNSFSQDSGASPEVVGYEKLEEIVVTAQKRKELLKDVPISINVLSGDKLDQSTFSGITEALRTVPGLDTELIQGGGGAVFSVRGVSSNGGAGPIAYYIDGASYGFVRSAVYPADPSVYDLQQIEFLSGPQGTLYGANALNGVLRIRTHDANLYDFEFKARTSGSSTNGGGENYRGDLAVNLPLIEGKLAARATVGYRSDDGWVDAFYPNPYPTNPSLAGTPFRSDVNEVKAKNYRLKLRAQPTETLSINLSAWRTERDYGAPSYANDEGRITSLVDQNGTDKFDVYGVEINKSFVAFSLSSMSSYLDYRNAGVVDGTPCCVPATLANRASSKVFSQEINLTSNLKGPWRWSAGVFYRDAKDVSYGLLSFLPESPFFPLVLVNTDTTDTSESAAVYGEIGRRLNDRLSLSVGLRYFHDDQSVKINQAYLPLPLTPFKATSEAVTPRVVFTWTPDSEHMMYVSYSQGFRSGFAQGPDLQVLAPNYTPVKPDKLTNYEIGSKGATWGSRLSYEMAIFYIDWQDIQQSLAVMLPPPQNTVTSAMVNGQSASGLGASLALTAHFFEGLELAANLGWNDLAFDADVCCFANGTLMGQAGTRPAFSPEYTVGGSAQYAFPLGGGGYRGRIGVSGDFKSPSISTSELGTKEGDSIFIVGARFSIAAPHHWTVTLYGDNLNNEDDTARLDPTVLEWSPRFRPRTVGLQLDFNF